jgi:hypothetical protein
MDDVGRDRARDGDRLRRLDPLGLRTPGCAREEQAMSLNWSDERFVKLYVRDTAEWLAMQWQGRALHPLLVRKADRSGVIPTRLGARGVAALVGLPLEVVEIGLVELDRDGFVAAHPLGYVIPDFIASQEARQSEKLRSAEYRARKREDRAAGVVTNRDASATEGDATVTTHEAITEIVTTFADAAKHDGLAYVAMSQLNREIEKRDDRRPQMSDLRESGSLEERAKCIVGLYRGSEYYDAPKKGVDYAEDRPAPSGDEFKRTVQLLVLKNSNGRKGRIFARWNGPTTEIK